MTSGLFHLFVELMAEPVEFVDQAVEGAVQHHLGGGCLLCRDLNLNLVLQRVRRSVPCKEHFRVSEELPTQIRVLRVRVCVLFFTF